MSVPQNEWERCKPWIEAAIAHSPGLETIEDIERQLAECTVQFWPAPNCAVITDVSMHNDKRVLTVRYGGGDLNELLTLVEPNLCEFARTAGCEAIIGLGRKGWERAAEKNGYRFAWVAMIKSLYN